MYNKRFKKNYDDVITHVVDCYVDSLKDKVDNDYEFVATQKDDLIQIVKNRINKIQNGVKFDVNEIVKDEIQGIKDTVDNMINEDVSNTPFKSSNSYLYGSHSNNWLGDDDPTSGAWGNNTREDAKKNQENEQEAKIIEDVLFALLDEDNITNDDNDDGNELKRKLEESILDELGKSHNAFKRTSIEQKQHVIDQINRQDFLNELLEHFGKSSWEEIMRDINSADLLNGFKACSSIIEDAFNSDVISYEIRWSRRRLLILTRRYDDH